MGKASSTKKVQRAARAGGRVSSGQPRSFLFPGILALVIVLGVSLIVYARQDRLNDDLGGTPQIGDHIHQAFGVYVCGEWKLEIPEFESTIGIHSHGDGVIHIHPHSQLGVGVNATLGRFLENAREEGGIDAELSNTRLDFLEDTIKEGETTCEGVEDPELLVAYWPDASDPEALPEITTGDFNDLRLTTNGAAITIYYGDPDAEIPKPPSAENLAALGAADGGQNLDPADANTTTTAGDSSTTSSSVAGDSTTSSSAPAP